MAEGSAIGPGLLTFAVFAWSARTLGGARTGVTFGAGRAGKQSSPGNEGAEEQGATASRKQGVDLGCPWSAHLGNIPDLQ